jgi:hypothetical protein
VIAASEDNATIRDLQAYKGKYCFAVTYEDDANKQYATAWVENTSNGGQEVARAVSTTVTAKADAQMSGKSATSDPKSGGSSTMSTQQSEIRDAMNNASYAGLQKAADFWTLSKNRATGREYYTAYALWTIDQSVLDTQIASNLQNMVDRNAAMSEAEKAIYADLIAELRTRVGSLMAK